MPKHSHIRMVGCRALGKTPSNEVAPSWRCGVSAQASREDVGCTLLASKHLRPKMTSRVYCPSSRLRSHSCKVRKYDLKG